MQLRTMSLRFRIWDKKENEWLKSNKPTEYWPLYCNSLTGVWSLDEDERFIISQDTGIKDINGVSIYTGDIIKESFKGDVLLTVGYSVDDGSIVGFSGDNKYWGEPNCESEVVGNIWQDGEKLLKRKENNESEN